MATDHNQSAPIRRNVLALDGGGIRGLSSLLVLRALMAQINIVIRSESYHESCEDLTPCDVFDLVTGTSTGGLIAIMLGKLGMSLDDCIQAYRNLAKKIFEKKHLRAHLTRGLGPTKYSGKCLERCIENVIRQSQLDEKIPMAATNNSDRIPCAVICREHCHQSKFSDIKEDAVRICSLSCPEKVQCLVSEAARATSAAPTFFPVQQIGDRYFVDGGLEYNNPSFTIYDHYNEQNQIYVARNIASSHHGGLDLSRVRFVNLGTGDKPKDLPPPQRDRLAQLMPGFIRMGVFLKRTLKEFAVNSQKTAKQMETLVRASHGDLIYERFSADNGVCYIKMDNHKALSDIDHLVQNYLDADKTKEKLKRVATEIAKEYLRKHDRSQAFNAATSTERYASNSEFERSRTDLAHNADTPPTLNFAAGGSASTSTNDHNILSQNTGENTGNIRPAPRRLNSLDISQQIQDPNKQSA